MNVVDIAKLKHALWLDRTAGNGMDLDWKGKGVTKRALVPLDGERTAVIEGTLAAGFLTYRAWLAGDEGTPTMLDMSDVP